MRLAEDLRARPLEPVGQRLVDEAVALVAVDDRRSSPAACRRSPASPGNRARRHGAGSPAFRKRQPYAPRQRWGPVGLPDCPPCRPCGEEYATFWRSSMPSAPKMREAARPVSSAPGRDSRKLRPRQAFARTAIFLFGNFICSTLVDEQQRRARRARGRPSPAPSPASTSSPPTPRSPPCWISNRCRARWTSRAAGLRGAARVHRPAPRSRLARPGLPRDGQAPHRRQQVVAFAERRELPRLVGPAAELALRRRRDRRFRPRRPPAHGAPTSSSAGERVGRQPSGPRPGQALNEYGEIEDEDSFRQRGEDARDSIARKLLRARRLYLREIADSPGKRAAFEILTELPIDWEKAERLEPRPTSRAPPEHARARHAADRRGRLAGRAGARAGQEGGVAAADERNGG